MDTVGRFMKVSFEQYSSMRKGMDEETVRKEYEEIQIPCRGTKSSAGYDFRVPYDVDLGEEPILIPTGIRALIQDDYFLMLVPRSGLGFKYGTRLLNTIGIIDADYFRADNEGHIMCKLVSKIPCSLKAGDRFVHGIFIPYGISQNGNSTAVRTGGMGSTGTK